MSDTPFPFDKQIRMYSRDQLGKLSHEALYRHFVFIRNHVCSCQPQDLDQPSAAYEESVVEALEIYLQRVTEELQRRPYQKFNKTASKEQRQQKLSDMKGNRNRPRNKNGRKAI